MSTEIATVLNGPLLISKTDLEYAYGQLTLSEETSKHCNFAKTGGNMNGYYRFRKRFHGLSDVPTIFQIRQTVEFPNTCFTRRYNPGNKV